MLVNREMEENTVFYLKEAFIDIYLRKITQKNTRKKNSMT